MSGWVLITHWGSRGILALLVLLSVWSVAVIIDRAQAIKREGNFDEMDHLRSLIRAQNWNALDSWAKSKTGLLSGLIRALLDVKTSNGASDHEKIEIKVRGFLTEEKVKLERGLSVLATLGANAPFVGLFGTVLGIIQAFAVLATNNTGPQAVMASVSEALVATAVGLFVAIPAVVGYNYFTRKLKTVLSLCESVRDEFIVNR